MDNELFESLLNPVDQKDTSRAAFTQDENVPDEMDVFSEIESLKTEAPEVKDTTDYTLPDDTEYILFDRSDLNRTLSQLTAVIDLNSSKAVSRGISIKVLSDSELEVICPNDVYYFKSKLNGKTTMKEDTVIYIEFSFIQHIAKFIPNKVLIYKNEDKLYLRLNTGDTGLINYQLLPQDLNKLKSEAEPTDELVIQLTKADIRKLEPLTKLFPLEAVGPGRIIRSFEDYSSFSGANLFAKTDLHLPKLQLKVMESNYLLKILPFMKDTDVISIYNTNKTTTKTLAIMFNNTTMITNYAEAVEDPRLKSILSELPDATVVDYNKLKYNISCAKANTYIKGNIILVNEEGILKLRTVSENNDTSDMIIDTLSTVTFPEGKAITVPINSLLAVINSLNPGINPKLGFKDGLLYILTDDVSIAMVTY